MDEYNVIHTIGKDLVHFHLNLNYLTAADVPCIVR